MLAVSAIGIPTVQYLWSGNSSVFAEYNFTDTPNPLAAVENNRAVTEAISKLSGAEIGAGIEKIRNLTSLRIITINLQNDASQRSRDIEIYTDQVILWHVGGEDKGYFPASPSLKIGKIEPYATTSVTAFSTQSTLSNLKFDPSIRVLEDGRLVTVRSRIFDLDYLFPLSWMVKWHPYWTEFLLLFLVPQGIGSIIEKMASFYSMNFARKVPPPKRRDTD